MAKGLTTYNFLKGLGQKIPQKEIEKEYNRIRKNLIRSVRGYSKKGISSSSFFQIPDKPKKITEGSLRKLEKSVAEWKYYTGRKLTEEEYQSLPKDITRAFQHNIGENAKRVAKLTRIDKEVQEAAQKYREDLEDQIYEKNKDNPEYQQMLEEGYSIATIPDRVTNDALGLYVKCENVFYEASDALANGDHTRNWWFIQLKAETAMSAFLNMGVQEYGSLYSFNIQHNKQGITYEEITDVLDTALYDSNQLDKDDRFSKIINLMIGDPRKLNAEERRQYDEIREALGLT